MTPVGLGLVKDLRLTNAERRAHLSPPLPPTLPRQGNQAIIQRSTATLPKTSCPTVLTFETSRIRKSWCLARGPSRSRLRRR